MFRLSMIINSRRRQLRVVYRHIKHARSTVIELPSGKLKPISYTTLALIQGWYRDKWRTYIEGAAYCSTLDQFSRPKGRKISLADAMQEIPDRNRRAKFWKAFFIAEKEEHYG